MNISFEECVSFFSHTLQHLYTSTIWKSPLNSSLIYTSPTIPEFENLLQLFFGAYKSAAIVFRVVFIIVRLFNTFYINDICPLCVWHDSIKEISIYISTFCTTVKTDLFLTVICFHMFAIKIILKFLILTVFICHLSKFSIYMPSL